MEKYVEALRKRTKVTEKMVDFLQKRSSEVESRKRKVDSAWESVTERMWEADRLRKSLDEREWELEDRERGFFMFEERRKRELTCDEEELTLKRALFLTEIRNREEELDMRIAVVNERAEWLEAAEAEVRETRRRASERLKSIEEERDRLKLDRESLVEREKKVYVIISALDCRISAVEKKEEDFNLFQEGKMREIASIEEDLGKKWEEFSQQVRLADEKFKKLRFMERIELAENKLDSVRAKMDERFEVIECRGNAGWESLGLSLKEAELIRDSMEKKLEEFEKMKMEFNSFQEEKNRELASKEELLKRMGEELVKDVKLRNEQLIEREELGHRLLERLKLANDHVEGLRRSVNERFKEVGLKMRELTSQEQELEIRSEEVFRDAKLKNRELREREKLGNKLLERLKVATDTVEELNTKVRNGFRENNMKETELSSLSDWVEKKMDEVDLKAREVEEREQRIAVKEAHLISKEAELQEMENHFSSWQKELEDKQKELEDKQKEVDSMLESNKQMLEKLDSREKNLNSVREFIRNCFKEHQAIKKKLLTEKDLVEKNARELVLKEQHLNHALEDIESREKQMEGTIKLIELKGEHSSNVFYSPMEIQPDEGYADLKFTVRMDGKALQMFLNDAEKDMESMGDEIFKVLHLSSDPAKLVLDAMVGFYPPRLREEDVEYNVRKTCIVLLDQLVKMCPKIKPCVKEEAIEVARSWKSKMRGSVENGGSMEVLGFLFLVTAFDIVSYFENDEISSFVTMVVDQRR